MKNFRRIATTAVVGAVVALSGITLAGPAQAATPSGDHRAHDTCHCQQGVTDIAFTTVEGTVVTVAGVV
ncbi:hypothetical protein [Streptomyces sp. RPT161]|uniref:hypothetical protein n=1 Tax=Streptomyces sp. RPT161 TaxID=3015993 RepID=UPI0022B90A6B|nr:hypothetical protein [Streptomyces sp. RPT161]